MGSIGGVLRNERLQRGLSLFEVSALTKIKPPLLEAIEADEFDKLPGKFFARSFIRQYARLLNVEDEIEPGLEERLGPNEPVKLEELAASVRQRPPVRTAASGPLRHLVGSQSGSRTGLALLALLCLTFLAWWPKEGPLEHGAGRAGGPLIQPATASAEPAEPQPAPQPGQSLVIDLGASRPAWVEVTADGRTVFSGTIQPNETRTFQGDRSLRVITRNAGALDLRFNGKSLGPMGPDGEARTVELTAHGARISVPPKRRFLYDPLG